MQVLFCNCCATDCDCGCVEDCRLVAHRPAPPITDAEEANDRD
jgi:hypothetical protein